MHSSKIRGWPLAAAMVASAFSPPAAAAEGEARVFAPSADWSLGNDAESCWILRQFGTREDGVILRLQAFSPGSDYLGVLWGKPLPQRDSGLLEFDYSFAPENQSISKSGVLTRSSGQPMLIFSTSLGFRDWENGQREGREASRVADEARTAAINAVTVNFSRGRPLTLQLGPIGDAIARLRTCASGLPGKWGLDPAVQQSLSRRATPIDTASWIAPGTYPWEYLRASQSLIVHLRIMVDASGAPSACVVQSARAESGAEQLACNEIMRTARFEPALDATGTPVASYYATRVFYSTRRRNGNN